MRELPNRLVRKNGINPVQLSVKWSIILQSNECSDCQQTEDKWVQPVAVRMEGCVTRLIPNITIPGDICRSN